MAGGSLIATYLYEPRKALQLGPVWCKQSDKINFHGIRRQTLTVMVSVSAGVGAVRNTTKMGKTINRNRFGTSERRHWVSFDLWRLYLHTWPENDEKMFIVSKAAAETSRITHQQMKRHRIKAMICVFPEASCSTRVAMLAWQDGQVNRVESGPTATFVSVRRKLCN